MPRRARLTVLELGAPSMAWAGCHAAGTDDWIVVAQQADETAAEFTCRVRNRTQRLRREDAQIERFDIYAGRGRGDRSSAARREVIEEVSAQMASGGSLTLWSASEDTRADAELSAILAQLGPILAERQVAMHHQSCQADERSGVRHAVPTRSVGSEEPESDCELRRGLDFGITLELRSP